MASTFGGLQLVIEWVPNEGITPLTCAVGFLTLTGATVLLFWEKRMTYPIVPVDMLLDRKLAALFAMSVSISV